jgi:hypothetical protein
VYINLHIRVVLLSYCLIVLTTAVLPAGVRPASPVRGQSETVGSRSAPSRLAVSESTERLRRVVVFVFLAWLAWPQPPIASRAVQGLQVGHPHTAKANIRDRWTVLPSVLMMALSSAA